MDVTQRGGVCANPRDGQQLSIVAGRRYRLALTAEQDARLGAWAGALRALWNAALEQRQTAWGRCGESVGLSLSVAT